MSAHVQILLVTADIISVATILGSLSGLLPPLASLGALVWYSFVIYDRLKYGPELENRTRFLRRKNLTPPPE